MKFLKLLGAVINPRYIREITRNADEYVIKLTPTYKGFFIWGSGGHNPIETVYRVNRTQHSTDYKTVTEWIDMN